MAATDLARNETLTKPGNHVPRWRRPDITANRIDRERLDRLADLIADGMTLTEAGSVLGVSMQRASQLFARIKAGLGWQAQ